MKNLQAFVVVGVLLLSFLGGCSRSSTPISPSGTEQSKMIPVGVSDRFPDGSPAAGEGLMGLFNLHVDPVKTQAELEPLRTGDLTDVLEVVDITNFLQMAPCTNCVKIKSVSLTSDGKLSVSIGIKHPFPVGDPFKPITGRNRADLHVFNIEGIVFSNTPGVAYGGIGATLAGFNLLSADGYTGYLDGPMDDIYPTDATIHPYVLHFDDYSVGNYGVSNPMGFQSVVDPPPSGNLVMAMGCDYDFQDYIFDVPSTPIDLMFGVGCTYGLSAATKAQRFSPEYRIPQYNKKAASEVHIEIVSNELIENDTASSAELAIKVLDMNHGVAVGDAIDQMLADSSVSQISIDIPGVLASPIVVASPTPTAGTGRDPLNPLDFHVTITNSASAAPGTYTGLVKVSDSYPVGLNSSPLLSGMDGIKRVDPLLTPTSGIFAITEFATFASFSVDVAEGVVLQACFTTNPDPPVVRKEIDATIGFDGSCSTDPSGHNIVLYEWDFDWDGIPANFVADEANAITTTSHLYTEAGPFKAALRVTNDASSPQTSEIVSKDITIHGWRTSSRLENDIVNTDMWWTNQPRIAITSDGIVHLFLENSGTTTTQDYYTCNESGIISKTTMHTGYVTSSGIFALPNDDIYLYYADGTGLNYFADTGSGFGTAQFVMNRETGRYLENATLAVNMDGDICGILAEEVSESQPGTLPGYIYGSINEGSGFSPKVLLDSPHHWVNQTGGGTTLEVTACADTSGKFSAAWHGLTGLYISGRSIWGIEYDGSWGTKIDIANTAQDEIQPKLEADGVGNTWCSYRNGGYQYLLKKNAGSSTFGTPMNVYDEWIGQNWDYDINLENGDIFDVWYVYQNPNRIAKSKIFNIANTQPEMLNALEWDIDPVANSQQMWVQVECGGAEGHAWAIWEDWRNGQSPNDVWMAMYW